MSNAPQVLRRQTHTQDEGQKTKLRTAARLHCGEAQMNYCPQIICTDIELGNAASSSSLPHLHTYQSGHHGQPDRNVNIMMAFHPSAASRRSDLLCEVSQTPTLLHWAYMAVHTTLGRCRDENVLWHHAIHSYQPKKSCLLFTHKPTTTCLSTTPIKFLVFTSFCCSMSEIILKVSAGCSKTEHYHAPKNKHYHAQHGGLHG